MQEFEFQHDPQNRSASRLPTGSSRLLRPWQAKPSGLPQYPSIGHSGLTDLSAMPQSLITEFMPDVSQIQSQGSSGRIPS